jgi:Raf kinase inhibitor-like YbhB/YbcL family protein
VFAVVAAAFALTSPALHAGGSIPRRYTCDGANVSPPLRWTAPPRRTSSFSLTVIDPGASGGKFVHWRIRRLSPGLRSLRAGSHQGGANSAGGSGWTGPCAPPGLVHHYVFQLRALARTARTLATARLVGLYRRA